MAYDYEFKYPRRKLHEIVGRYLGQMHTMGRTPNCGVSFSSPPPTTPDMRGWLLVQSGDPGSGERYLLLEDGDVWVGGEVKCPEELVEGGWLAAPCDDLAVLLAHSLMSARTGGDGLLASGDIAARQLVVEDRRRTMQAFAGREKRTS